MKASGFAILLRISLLFRIAKSEPHLNGAWMISYGYVDLTAPQALRVWKIPFA